MHRAAADIRLKMGNAGLPNHLRPHVNALRGRSLACDMFCLLCNVAIVAAEVTRLTLLLVNVDFVRFLVDRRPASNIDSYIVAAVILSTSCLNGKGTDDLVTHYDKWCKFLKKEGIELA